jgi:hypothetical protein
MVLSALRCRVHLCVRVCVCVSERERERERAACPGPYSVPPNLYVCIHARKMYAYRAS